MRVHHNGDGGMRIINPITGFTTVRRGSRSFDLSSAQYFTGGIHAGVNPGDSSFWFAAWCRFDSVPVSDGHNRGILGLWTTGGDRAWLLSLVDVPGFSGWRILLRNAADSGNTAIDAMAAMPSVGTWYFVLAYHDAENNEVGISINGGSFDVTPYSAGVKTGSSTPFLVGWTNSGGIGEYMDGLLTGVAVGQLPSGDMSALAPTIAAALYNSGNGVGFAELSSAQKTAWGLTTGNGVWFDLNETVAGDDAVDSVAGNDLTSVNTVGVSSTVP